MFNFLEDIERGDQAGSFKLKPVPEDPQQDILHTVTSCAFSKV
jgi:hypothetical protein